MKSSIEKLPKEKIEAKIYTPTTPMTDIEPIEQRSNITILKEEDLENIVEAPLLPAVQQLWRKNITTISSTANKKNITPEGNGEALLVIRYDTLTDQNKKILHELTQTTEDNIEEFGEENIPVLTITIPFSQESTLQEFQENALKTIESLQEQPERILKTSLQERVAATLGIPQEDLQDIDERDILKILEEEYGLTIENFMSDQWQVYDPETLSFYQTEEQLQEDKRQRNEIRFETK